MDRAKQVEEHIVKIFKSKYVHGNDYDWVEPESIFNIIFRNFPNFKIKIDEVENACDKLEGKKVLASCSSECGRKYVWNKYQKKPVVRKDKMSD